MADDVQGGSITKGELDRGKFDPYRTTAEDVRLYMSYPTARLRLLSWFGDPVAARILKNRR